MEKRKEYYKEYYKKKKEEISKKYFDNKEEILTIRKKYYENNKDYISEYNKKWREENSEHLQEYNKKWREENSEHLKEYSKEYKESNKEHYKKYQREYMQNRLTNDPLFKLNKNIRTLIKKSTLEGKGKKTTDIIGCSIEYFKIYLETKFESWMTWENWGLYNGDLNYGWDIDHIIPVSSAKTEEDILKLNHYTNLQPLCSKINRYIKKDKVKETQCLFCGNKLEYISYCDDMCGKKYYRKQ